MSETYHLLPINDSHPHIESIHCDCCPYRDAEWPELIIHNAFDGRELRERLQAIEQQPPDVLS